MTAARAYAKLADNMARNPTFPLYDRILDGKLEALLRELAGAELSIPEIRDALRDDHQVSVSVNTVRRWLADIGVS